MKSKTPKTPKAATSKTPPSPAAAKKAPAKVAAAPAPKTPPKAPAPTAKAATKAPAKVPAKPPTKAAPKASTSPKPAKTPTPRPAPTPEPTAASPAGIRIEVNLGPGEAAYLAGTFNEWNETSLPLSPLGDGRWFAELDLPPGEYEYLLIVDGRWLPDPGSPAWVPNPFGGVNSVLRVG